MCLKNLGDLVYKHSKKEIHAYFSDIFCKIRELCLLKERNTSGENIYYLSKSLVIFLQTELVKISSSYAKDSTN